MKPNINNSDAPKRRKHTLKDQPVVGKMAEIAQAIAEHRAVAFVGAGVSATVGLTTWQGLLSAQKESSKLEQPDTDDLRKITEILDSGDLTLSASLLKRLRGQKFTEDLAFAIRQVKSAGSAHLAVARLPFNKVITTNYDQLLEQAYQPFIPDVINYKEHEPLIKAITDDTFTLIKLHGNISTPDETILTDDDFRSIQRNQPLVQCLRILFLTKHVVFIGHSLRDPDLLSLLSDLKQQFPYAGPHYALLDDDAGVDSKTGAKKTKNAARCFLDHLSESLNIHAVVYQYVGNNRNDALTRQLTILHGEVCRLQSPKSPLLDVNPNQSLVKQLARLLERACRLTGSFRGDLAFFNDRKYSGWATNQSRLRADQEALFGDAAERNRQESNVLDTGLYVDYCFGPTDRNITKEQSVGEGARHLSNPALCFPRSAIWTSFNWSRGPKLLNDANDIQELQSEYIENYRASDTRVVSELAVPISVGDFRVGVLNLESNIKGAYTKTHTQVAIGLTHEIGRVWDAIVRSEIDRDATLDPNRMRIDPSSVHPPVRRTSSTNGTSELASVIEKLLPFNIGFSLFVADHGTGRLIRRFGSKRDGRKARVDWARLPDYSFESPSFASMVFRKQRPLYLPNRKSTPEWIEVNGEIASELQIGDELLGVPLFSRGARIGVLTAWPKPRIKDNIPIGADGAELIFRTSQLFARTDYLRQITQFQNQHNNTFQSCMKFKKLLSSFTSEEMSSQLETLEGKANPNIIKLLACIREMVGVCSMRLFWIDDPYSLNPGGLKTNIKFNCRGSIRGGRKREDGGTSRNVPISNRFKEHTEHIKMDSNGTDNPYVEYVVRRAFWSASTMLLYPGLLNTKGAPHAAAVSLEDGPNVDSQAIRYGRDPRAGWYVAPITRCVSQIPADNETDWITEQRNLLGFLVADNTVNLKAEAEEINEFPASRTWNELARLKLTWCAATIGHHMARASPRK